MKVSVIRLAIRPTTFAAAIGVNLLIATKVPAQAIAPAAVASPPPAQMTTGATAEMERVIVTGSNIPTAEETGPNPVDTYRPADMEKLGIRNATDLLTNLPQEMGTTSSQTNLGFGDGAVIPNLRGLLPKETLVLIDGKRVAIVGRGGLGGSSSGSSAPGVDINLIPFPMIDHIDILKDGASAVYGSDAVAGVINIFLLHKFRGLEIGGSIGNTNLGASNDARELEGWLKAGTGDDKTEIVVIADFWERTGGLFSTDRDISSNAFQVPWGGGDFRSVNFPGRVQLGRLLPSMFFGPGGTPQIGVNTPLPHSAPNAATSPFYKNPFAVNLNAYPGAPGVIGPNAAFFFPQFGTDYKGGGDYFFYNFAAVTPALPPAGRAVRPARTAQREPRARRSTPDKQTARRRALRTRAEAAAAARRRRPVLARAQARASAVAAARRQPEPARAQPAQAPRGRAGRNPAAPAQGRPASQEQPASQGQPASRARPACSFEA
jgi:outer membrane receptor protein involved in Fe transport